MGSGWQNGISSLVFFAAMTPAMTAVAKMGPCVEHTASSPNARATTTARTFGPDSSVMVPPSPWLLSEPTSACSTSRGRMTLLRARAVRVVTALSPTSTMVGSLPAASRCVNPA